jgi:hypothetical protein
MSANRWTVSEIRCLDCGTSFTVTDPNMGIHRSLHNSALVVMCPPQCPRCHNLHVVDNTTFEGDDAEEIL